MCFVLISFIAKSIPLRQVYHYHCSAEEGTEAEELGYGATVLQLVGGRSGIKPHSPVRGLGSCP